MIYSTEETKKIANLARDIMDLRADMTIIKAKEADLKAELHKLLGNAAAVVDVNHPSRAGFVIEIKKKIKSTSKFSAEKLAEILGHKNLAKFKAKTTSEMLYISESPKTKEA